MEKEKLTINLSFIINSFILQMKDWFNNGVKYITDLMDNNGNFIKYEEFVDETGVQSNFIQFTDAIACITKFMKENRVKIEKKQGQIFPSLIEVIQKTKKRITEYLLNFE